MEEEEMNQWLMLGHIAEREQLGERFKKESGEYYANGKNERAGHCRAIANELLLSAKQMREDYNKKFHIAV
ncbi:hypothetical protein LCGC14_2973160 [marine sediment metagenome]|uniref:Uncharacterized protein n=1 Tax=marine sediment metagenome TaxID=412755 RepID=A0A0F8X8U1_9ZZZZ